MRNKPIRPGMYDHLFRAQENAALVRERAVVKKIQTIVAEPLVDPLTQVAVLAAAASARKRRKPKADNQTG